MQHIGSGVRVDNQSATQALLALQGPDAEAILQRLCAAPLGSLPYYQALTTHLDGYEALVSRTGYTGEDGFEVLVPATHAVAVVAGHHGSWPGV